MNLRVPVLLALGAILGSGAAVPASSQLQPATACSDSAGGNGPGTLHSRFPRVPVDTVYRLSIGRKEWSGEHVSGSIGAGFAGMERASWSACAGARVYMRRAAVVLENVQGEVHLRASLAPLLEALRRRRADPPPTPGGDR